MSEGRLDALADRCIPPPTVDLSEAARLASEFLDAHIVKLNGFSPTGEIEDFMLEFQDAYEGEEDTLVVAFVVRPDVDPDEPPPEVLSLARQCCDALVAAHPEVNEFSIAFEFLH